MMPSSATMTPNAIKGTGSMATASKVSMQKKTGPELIFDEFAKA